MAEKSYVLAGRKLFIAIPAYDHKVALKLAISLTQLAQRVGEHGVTIAIGSVCGCSVVSRARNILLDQFFKSDFTDLMFIDSDITFDPTDVLRLLAFASDDDKNIVAGVPRTRRPQASYIVSLDENEDKSIIVDDMGLIRAKRVATAFMVVQRRVFETLRDNHPEWKYHDNLEKIDMYSIFDFKSTPEGYVGEDFLFCDRARAHGFKVWVDSTVKLGHMGVAEYEGDFGREGLTAKIIRDGEEPSLSDVA